jgi:hypothetical protein
VEWLTRRACGSRRAASARARPARHHLHPSQGQRSVADRGEGVLIELVRRRRSHRRAAQRPNSVPSDRPIGESPTIRNCRPGCRSSIVESGASNSSYNRTHYASPCGFS